MQYDYIPGFQSDAGFILVWVEVNVWDCII